MFFHDFSVIAYCLHWFSLMINTSFITTALFNMYMSTEQRIISRFKYLLVGGEPLDPSVIRAAIKQCKPKHLMNGYGPTENTTFSTYKDITFLPEHATTVPVGRPISGSTGYVLDEFLQPVPIGVKGELYVGGDGVAVGYLNDPERTEKSFIPDPFSSDAEAKLYRTGDIARYNDEGEIEILGRAVVVLPNLQRRCGRDPRPRKPRISSLTYVP